jgi:cytochrome c1
MSSIDFTSISLPVPKNMNILSSEEQTDIYNYLLQMSDTHKKAYLIAFNHLGTSFNIYKSNGYKEWKNKK